MSSEPSPERPPRAAVESCLNCHATLVGAYCAQCGQPAGVKRLSFSAVAKQTVEEIAELDRPLLRTCVDLFTRPGRTAADYVEGRRRRYTNPLKYCLLCGTLVVAAPQLIAGFDPTGLSGLNVDLSTIPEENRRFLAAFSKWYSQWAHLFYFLTLPVLALLLRGVFFFRRRNVAEHLVFCLFTYGQVYLVQLLFMVLADYVHSLFVAVSSLFPFVYLSLAAGGFVGGSRLLAFPLSLVAHLVYGAIVSALIVAVTLITMQL